MSLVNNKQLYFNLLDEAKYDWIKPSTWNLYNPQDHMKDLSNNCQFFRFSISPAFFWLFAKQIVDRKGCLA